MDYLIWFKQIPSGYTQVDGIVRAQTDRRFSIEVFGESNWFPYSYWDPKSQKYWDYHTAEAKRIVTWSAKPPDQSGQTV